MSNPQVNCCFTPSQLSNPQNQSLHTYKNKTYSVFLLLLFCMHLPSEWTLALPSKCPKYVQHDTTPSEPEHHVYWLPPQARTMGKEWTPSWEVKRRHWGEGQPNLAATPPPPPPKTPTDTPKHLESEFITLRKLGKRRLSSDSSNSERESLDSQTLMKMTRVGEDVMADTATTPPASPTNTIIPAATSGQDNVGKKSPQPADKPKAAPTVQKANPAPKPRQEYPSRKPGKQDQKFQSQPDSNSHRKQFQPSTRAPAFADFLVIIHDFGCGLARFNKLGPWHHSQLLSNAVGAVRSITPLPSGKWLIECATEAQQSKLARLDKLPGGTPMGAWIPRPVVEGVVGPIPMGGDELKLVKQDLEAGGHRVAGVVRLNNRKQEPSLAVKISLEATELPSEVWLSATPFTVQAFAALVRWCTKCQTFGHSKQQCRSKQTRCSKCRKGSHSHEQCNAQVFSCVNCNGHHSAAYKGCPEMQIRQRANLLRSKTYIPYKVAMQRACDELKPKAPPPAQPASAAWAFLVFVHLSTKESMV